MTLLLAPGLHKQVTGTYSGACHVDSNETHVTTHTLAMGGSGTFITCAVHKFPSHLINQTVAALMRTIITKYSAV